MIYFLASLVLAAFLWKIKTYWPTQTTGSARTENDSKTGFTTKKTESDKSQIPKKESETPKCTLAPEKKQPERVDPSWEETKQSVGEGDAPPCPFTLTSDPAKEKEGKEIWVGTVRVEEVHSYQERDDGFAEEDVESEECNSEVEKGTSSSFIASRSSSDGVITREGTEAGEERRSPLSLGQDFGTRQDITETTTIRRTVLNKSLAIETCKTAAVETNTSAATTVVMETHNIRDIELRLTYSDTNSAMHVAKCRQISEKELRQEESSIPPSAVQEEDSGNGSFPRKKKPVGGVCLLGGEELLSKIKKRRIALENAEAERNTAQRDTLQEGGGKEAKQGVSENTEERDVAVKKEDTMRIVLDAEDILVAKETSKKDHRKGTFYAPANKDKETDNRGLLPSSWASSLSQLPPGNDCGKESYGLVGHSHEGGPDSVTSMDTGSEDAPYLAWGLGGEEGHQIILLPTDGEVLTHLNKDRPRGPIKRRPSFNAVRI